MAAQPEQPSADKQETFANSQDYREKPEQIKAREALEKSVAQIHQTASALIENPQEFQGWTVTAHTIGEETNSENNTQTLNTYTIDLENGVQHIKIGYSVYGSSTFNRTMMKIDENTESRVEYSIVNIAVEENGRETGYVMKDAGIDGYNVRDQNNVEGVLAKLKEITPIINGAAKKAEQEKEQQDTAEQLDNVANDALANRVYPAINRLYSVASEFNPKVGPPATGKDVGIYHINGFVEGVSRRLEFVNSSGKKVEVTITPQKSRKGKAPDISRSTTKVSVNYEGREVGSCRLTPNGDGKGNATHVESKNFDLIVPQLERFARLLEPYRTGTAEDEYNTEFEGF